MSSEGEPAHSWLAGRSGLRGSGREFGDAPVLGRATAGQRGRSWLCSGLVACRSVAVVVVVVVVVVFVSRDEEEGEEEKR